MSFITTQNGGTATTPSAGKSFISTLIARMPYTFNILQSAISNNPKYDLFHDVVTQKEKRLGKLSLFQNQDQENFGMSLADKRYSNFLYVSADLDKVKRLAEYRKMVTWDEMNEAVEEIADEAVAVDEQGEIVNLKLRGNFEKEVEKQLQDEWKKYITLFDMDNKGYEYFRSFLVEGEMFWENVISENRPDYGVLGVVRIPSELINPIYNNIQNQIIEAFLLRKPTLDVVSSNAKQAQEELILFDRAQVTYINSGIWNEDKTFRLPYIENARKAYKRLSLLEDAIIIYRLVRAPERLVFKVDVGNMPVPKAREELRRIMQETWSRKNFDSSQGRVTNVYDPMSMTDAYWFTKRGQEGTTVDVLPGGQNLGQLEDLNYFIRKLYKSLRIPVSRLNSDDPFKDGVEITREELKFARFIIRLQHQFASGLKDGFITHLKLREKIPEDSKSKSVWEKFNLREHQIKIEFNTPTSFAVMREQQLFDMKSGNYGKFTSDPLMSHSFLQKYYLGYDEAQIIENRKWLKLDAAAMWEINQITNLGPNWKEAYQAQADAAEGGAAAAGGGGGGGGSALPTSGGGSAGSELPPDFGPAPETGAPAAGSKGEAPSANAGQEKAPPAEK